MNKSLGSCASNNSEAHHGQELASLEMSPGNPMMNGSAWYQLPWKMPAEGPPSTDSELEKEEVNHCENTTSRRIAFNKVDHEEEILEKKMAGCKEGTLFLPYWSS